MSDTHPTNVLIIMSDEHSRKVLGCYGGARAKTPNLDRLAARGTIFKNAYTPSPICVPARAAFATGLECHQTGHWDNATPYTGTPQSWGHKLQQNGNLVGSIGKLHYRNVEDATGFDFQELPMHLVNGVGDVLGCVREPLPRRWKARAMADDAGRGESSYTRYDRQITGAAVDWIKARGEEKASEKPWCAFVSLVAPHFPLIAPDVFFDLFADSDIMPTKAVDEPEHPWVSELRRCFVYDNFTEERIRTALTAYYGLVSFMDDNVGQILDALDETGQAANTRVIYVSDHGDNMGERELWGKSNMFEEACGIPTIAAGPGIPKGRALETPVTLTDIYPTVLDAVGLGPADDRPGRSLMDLANADDAPERVAFSQYHAAGACTGAFMVRKGPWKYIYYAGLAPQLYNLEDDPEELHDLGVNPKYGDVRDAFAEELAAICDADEVDKRCKADQRAIIEANGGLEAVLERGGFGATPAPGEAAKFVKA